MYTLEQINKMDQTEFIKEIGWVFEHTPWIAKKSWGFKPFNNFEALYDTMVNVVKEAAKEDQLDLIRAHPDLAGRIQMTESSVKEQKGAGLDTLTEEEYNNFANLNKAYLDKFSFPFILAVKGHTKDSIYSEMETRLNQEPDQEFQTALAQIQKIVLFRLQDLIIEKTETIS
ncbi:2-oxo-4-hydroxy-4-carboxy-5-ureidoimidazoline decarboxylase [Niallia sp. 01092]|uniref:2-oxo-4-hydroxy-4-carboxy-5-ureidoimidazoline decarboxylase n=1 Tax=unclassified Niallia TaxID=2837522 RepID=UPI003FD43E4D